MDSRRWGVAGRETADLRSYVARQRREFASAYESFALAAKDRPHERVVAAPLGGPKVTVRRWQLVYFVEGAIDAADGWDAALRDWPQASIGHLRALQQLTTLERDFEARIMVVGSLLAQQGLTVDP